MKPQGYRVLYNGDANYLFQTDYRRPEDRGGPYTARVLDDHVDRLHRSGIDTYIYNVNAQAPWYFSHKLEHVLTNYTRGDTTVADTFYPPPDDTFSPQFRAAEVARLTEMFDRYLDLHEQGIDHPAQVAQSCHDRGMRAWVSIRMNDAHGVSMDTGNYMDCPPRRKRENRLKPVPLNPNDDIPDAWACANYGKQEVRDYYLTMIREVIERYDFDGIELDWLRTMTCCQPTASEDEIETMTEFHRQVRAAARKREQRTGKPFPVSMRTAVRLDAMRTIGLDVAAIAREDLIDVIAPSNYFQTTWDTPHGKLREQVGDNVAIFGVMECTPNWLYTANDDASIKNYRLLGAGAPFVAANAAGKWTTGADAIEIYNFFAADEAARLRAGSKPGCDYDAVNGIGDIEQLRGRPKHYCTATSFNFWSPRFFEWAEQTPTSVETGGWRRFEFAMCAEPTDQNLSLTAQIVVDRTETLPQLGVSLNGAWPNFDATPTGQLLTRTGEMVKHIGDHIGLNFTLPLDLVRDGMNELVVFDGSGNAAAYRPRDEINLTRIVSVELSVH